MKTKSLGKYSLKSLKSLKKLKSPLFILKSQKGVALLMAISSLMLILYIAMEVMYDSNVEYVVNSNAIHRLKAYYAARSAMEISLLRVKIYQIAQNKLGKNLGDQAKILEEIWRFPFAWPPPSLPDMGSVDAENLKATIKESILDTSYMATIEDEGSKIDLNDLVSISEPIRKATHQQLLNIFQTRLEEDEEFRNIYSGVHFTELVNSIADWMSDKSSSLNGGDKKSHYSDLKSDQFPPNRGFRTVQELRMVAGMTDEFFEMLEPRITIYGMHGVNPNLATKDVIRSLDVGITDEIASDIIKRRDTPSLGGPFKKKEEFWQFVTEKGARLRAQKPAEDIPLVFESATNFKIRATGVSSNTTSEIYAIVMNINKAASQLKTMNDELQKKQNPTASPTPTPTPTPGPGQTPNPNSQQNGAQNNETLPKGPPRIVYWNEQ